MNEKKLHIIYPCFPKGKQKVLTMSYDDGCVEDRKLVKIFNQYGVKGTFHLNGGLTEGRIPAEEWNDLYEGHEISCHTYLHPAIHRFPIEQVIQQIIEDRRVLEEAVGYPVRGMSYPYGVFSEEIVKHLPATGIRYSRTVVSTNGFELPENYLLWNATCHHNDKLMDLAKEFAEYDRRRGMCMMYVWGHSYEFERQNNWELIESFCSYMANRDDIWYATNIEIVDYMEAVSRLQYTVNGEAVYNPSVKDVWLEIDGRIVKAESGKLTKLV